MNARTEKPDHEILTPSQRFGEVVGVIVMFLFFGFFAYHQVARTGFFTAEFGPQEMVLFYGSMLLTVAAPITRALVGRRNPARLFEAVSYLFTAIAALWLLIVFPFNFAHLADALPGGIRFLLAWVNNDIGRIPFIVQLIVCPIMALVTGWQYVSHLGRQPRSPSTPHPAW